jgi:hypothetical protein
VEDPDKAGGVMTIEDGALAPPQDFKPTESTFMAKTADTEAPQPCMLVEAKCIPDKPLKEPIEKIATSKAHLIAQGFCQTSSLDIGNPKPLSAPVPPLTDPAPASTMKCVITQNMPHHRAINTSNWATLAMCPDTTFPDANSSIAIDWCAISGYTSHIDDSTICWHLRQQADISSTTPNVKVSDLKVRLAQVDFGGKYLNTQGATPLV